MHVEVWHLPIYNVTWRSCEIGEQWPMGRKGDATGTTLGVIAILSRSSLRGCGARRYILLSAMSDLVHEQRMMVEGRKQLPYLGALAGIVATRAVTAFSVQRHDLSGEDTRGVAELGPGEDWRYKPASVGTARNGWASL